jgi:hypothetical protein
MRFLGLDFQQVGAGGEAGRQTGGDGSLSEIHDGQLLAGKEHGGELASETRSADGDLGAHQVFGHVEDEWLFVVVRRRKRGGKQSQNEAQVTHMHSATPEPNDGWGALRGGGVPASWAHSGYQGLEFSLLSKKGKRCGEWE